MSEKPSPEEAALWRRRLASQANNRAWTLAESLSRTPDEDEEMLQAAHAAMYFWKIVGNSRNQAHAAQLVAHVYALLGQAEPAKYFQAKSQPMLLGEGAQAWEQAMAHAVAANVAAANNDAKVHSEHYREAVRLTESLADADRKVLNATLQIVPRPKGL